MGRRLTCSIPVSITASSLKWGDRILKMQDLQLLTHPPSSRGMSLKQARSLEPTLILAQTPLSQGLMRSPGSILCPRSPPRPYWCHQGGAEPLRMWRGFWPKDSFALLFQKVQYCLCAIRIYLWEFTSSWLEMTFSKNLNRFGSLASTVVIEIRSDWSLYRLNGRWKKGLKHTCRSVYRGPAKGSGIRPILSLWHKLKRFVECATARNQSCKPHKHPLETWNAERQSLGIEVKIQY